jgi:hypothetical protein
MQIEEPVSIWNLGICSQVYFLHEKMESWNNQKSFGRRALVLGKSNANEELMEKIPTEIFLSLKAKIQDSHESSYRFHYPKSRSVL